MRFSRRFGLVLAATVLSLTVATTGAVADPTEPTTETTGTPAGPPPTEEAAPPEVRSAQDLTMTAAFDKPSYTTGEAMTITVTVTNTGTEAVTTRVMFSGGNPDTIQVDTTVPVEQHEPFTVAGGESVTLTLTGGMGNPVAVNATLYAFLVDDTGLATPFTFTVPVTPTTGHASGVVFYDKNRNREFDPGEGQRDVTLTWSNRLHYETVRTATTDENGEFRLADLPTGPYDVSGEGRGGLRVGWQRFDVTESGVDGLLFRAAAPLHGLFPTVEFTKDVYAPHESPVVRVTLDNTSDLTISGLVAACNRSGEDTGLTGTGEGWGELVRDGVDLAPHTKTTFEVTEPMPPGAANLGIVTISCQFSYPEVESTHNPYSFDVAAVPGLRGDLTGMVAGPDAGLPGVRLLLVADPQYSPEPVCSVTAETTTGPDGRFEFRQVPVGVYVVYPYPPPGWMLNSGTFSRTDVRHDFTADMYLTAAPGETVDPPVLPSCIAAGTGPDTATPAKVNTPAPRARTATALAYTGTDVLVPGVAGLLAVLVGTVMVLVSRRRRPS